MQNGLTVAAVGPDTLRVAMAPVADRLRIDDLTSLPNLAAFQEDLCRRLAEWRRRQTPLSVMRINVDRFREINDAYGRRWGDEVLRGTGRILVASMREMDLVARLTDDEFAVILPATRSDEAAAAAKRVRGEIADARFALDDDATRITVSIGLAEVALGDCITILLERADAALAAAKHSGGNCVHFHNGRASKAIPAFEPEGFFSTPESETPVT